MAKNFSELYAKLPPEARARVDLKKQAMVEEIEKARNKKIHTQVLDALHVVQQNTAKRQATA